MSPHGELLLSRHLPDPGAFAAGESALLPALVRWLVATGRVRARTTVAHEVPWLGRHVDLALLNGRGITTAFELKIGRLQRVLEQAAYNGTSFHRSWVVTGNHPQANGLRWARDLGVGLLVVRAGLVQPLTAPAERTPHPAALRRLRAAIQTRAVAYA